MADTLEELRRHIDDLIGRLSEDDESAGAAAELDQSPGVKGRETQLDTQLNTQIEALGHKIEGASDVLAELSDLLESQTERIETIEHQLGEDEETAVPLGAAAQPMPMPMARPVVADTTALELALQQGFAGIEQRLLAIETRLGSFEEAVAELRARALQSDRETRELESRVMVLAEAALTGNSQNDVVCDADVACDAEVVAGPVIAQAAAASEILDSAAVRRLEELVEREVALQREFAPGAEAVSAPQPRRGRPTVMVVDDSPDARTILSIYLSKTGFQVVSASSAEDCLAKLRHHSVDAVVLDASMPGGSGAHVCEVLRGDASYTARGRVPVIVYTAYPDEFTRDAAEKWGADEYVVKGGDMLPLMSALIRCIENDSPRESQQGSSATL